jgi:hypothetical protein
MGILSIETILVKRPIKLLHCSVEVSQHALQRLSIVTVDLMQLMTVVGSVVTARATILIAW